MNIIVWYCEHSYTTLASTSRLYMIQISTLPLLFRLVKIRIV